jgi:hypothetical protein
MTERQPTSLIEVTVRKPNEKPQLWRTIGGIGANARRRQRLHLFKPACVVPIFYSSHGTQIRILLPLGCICSVLHRVLNSPLTENPQIAPVRVQFGGILAEAGV